jgi:hypothetical protein
MYWAATWVVGVHPHQVMLADVAEPLLPAVPPPQAARTSARKLRTEMTGIVRLRHLMLGDVRIVPPGAVGPRF